MDRPPPRYSHIHEASEKMIGYVEEYDVRFNDRRNEGLTPYMVLKDGDNFTKHAFLVFVARSVSDPPVWCLSRTENVWGAGISLDEIEQFRLAKLAIDVLNGNGKAIGVTHGDALERIA